MQGCPEGMYPTGTKEITYLSEAKDLAELKDMVEPMLGVLNFVIGWWFDDDDGFTVTMYMPRKMETWGVNIKHPNRSEVQGWLDTTVRAEVEEWYGWK